MNKLISYSLLAVFAFVISLSLSSASMMYNHQVGEQYSIQKHYNFDGHYNQNTINKVYRARPVHHATPTYRYYQYSPQVHHYALVQNYKHNVRVHVRPVSNQASDPGEYWHLATYNRMYR